MSGPSTRKALQERLGFDQVTHMMLSASLLGALMDVLLSGHPGSVSVKEFYDGWKANVQSTRFAPFNPGLILGDMYLSILFLQQKWPNAAPDIPLTSPQASDWGLSRATILAPRKSALTVRYVLKRIRNSLGHARVSFRWPPGTPTAKILDSIALVFEDANPRDARDTFSAEISIKDAFQLAKKYHVTAGELLAKTYGGTPIYDVDWTHR